MKKILICLMAVALCLSCSTKRSLPDRITRFVDKAEATADSKTPEDWKKTNQQYEALVSEFNENYSTYSDEDKKVVYEAIGRYNALLVKNGLNNVVNDVQNFLKDLPNAVDGLLKGASSELEK